MILWLMVYHLVRPVTHQSGLREELMLRIWCGWAVMRNGDGK